MTTRTAKKVLDRYCGECLWDGAEVMYPRRTLRRAEVVDARRLRRRHSALPEARP